MNSTHWVSGPALELVMQLRGIKLGDWVKVDVAAVGGNRSPGGMQDPALINGKPIPVTRADQWGLAVEHPNYTIYYIQSCEVVAWRPKELGP